MRVERNIVFWVAALAVFVALLWLLSPILLPFVLGMAIAYVLDPLANQLSKRGVGRLLAAVLILGGFIVALALLVLLIAPVLAGQLSAFIDNVPAYAFRLQAFVSDPSHPWIKRIIGDNLTGADKSVGDPHRDCRRHRSVRPVSRRQCAGAEACRQKRRIASGLADFRAVRVRLSFRFRRPPVGGAAGGGLRRAHPLRAVALLRQSALYRQPAALMSSGR